MIQYSFDAMYERGKRTDTAYDGICRAMHSVAPQKLTKLFISTLIVCMLYRHSY